MFGFGIGLTVASVVVGGAFLIALAIGFGHALGRGKPKSFHKLDTGDYLLHALVPAVIEEGRPQWAVLSPAGKIFQLIYVEIPRNCIEILAPSPVGAWVNGNSAAMTVQLALAEGGNPLMLPAEIIEKGGQCRLRVSLYESPRSSASTSVAGGSGEPAVAVPPPTPDEPPTPIAEQKTLIISHDSPKSANGGSEIEVVPPVPESGVGL